MGRRGPVPQSNFLKLLRGNPGKRPLNMSGPEPDAPCDLAPPEWLDECGKQVWQQLAHHLVSMGLLTLVDVFAFARYCDMSSEWRALASRKGELGLTYTIEKRNQFGEIIATQYKERPEHSMMLKLSAELLRMEREFGLTPAARTGLHISVPQGPDDPYEVFD